MSKKEKKAMRKKYRALALGLKREADRQYFFGNFEMQERYKREASRNLQYCIKKTKEYMDIEYHEYLVEA